MKISQFTDFSLRALLYLAGTQDRLVTIAEVADHHGISTLHLKKVIQALSAQGVVKTVRGKGGGIRLGKDPHDINLGQLIRGQENLQMVDCTACAAKSCKLPSLFNTGTQAFLAVFDSKTLADIL